MGYTTIILIMFISICRCTFAFVKPLPLSLRSNFKPTITCRRPYTSALSTSPTPSPSSSLPPPPPSTTRVILMRHGESEFNTANIFTGWCDVALTPRGVVEATEAGQVFLSCGLRFRKCYTSVLSRSISTAFRSLESAGVGWVDMVKDWR